MERNSLTPTKETEHLSALIHEAYVLLDDAGADAISIWDLAEAVFKRIDPKHTSTPLVELAAVLELRQLARASCRRRQRDEEAIDEQESLFDVHLQHRYPAERMVHGEMGDVYVYRWKLTFKERMRNVVRLENEARAKQLHADALRAETMDLVRQGTLSEKELETQEAVL